jgi:hypothetical protein
VQLAGRFEDGTRSAMSLDLPWDALCQSGVVNRVGEIRQRMDAHGLGLAEAYGLIHSAPTAETGRLDWEAVVQKVLLSGEGRRETTLRDLRRRMARTLEVFQATPRCRDGRSLLRAYAA